MSIPSLTAWVFAAAGLICATGPVIIHLLNRRRYQTIHWGAMDFLREALQRNRRAVEIRDIALLVLRTLAIFLFGLALAQPFVSAGSIFLWAIIFPAVVAGLLCAIVAAAMWSESMIRWILLASSVAAFSLAFLVLFFQFGTGDEGEDKFDGSQPLHAILVVDNSMSMGYGDGDLLKQAKDRAKQFIEKLPEGSPVSVIPLCGSTVGFSPDPYPKSEALEAIDKIAIVDRAARLQDAVSAAKKASQAEPHLAKRIVILSDQQLGNWEGLTDPDQFADFPEIQLVAVSPDTWENSWISDFRIADGLADVETPTTFVVEIRHEGAKATDLQIALRVNGTEVASKTVTVQPGTGAREVRFEHLFNAIQVEPGRPASVPVTAVITPSETPDRLTADDTRHLVAHVVASLPVVFVDQYGADRESVRESRIGETKALRKLLAPVTSRDDRARQLVTIRHVRMEQLNRDVLADARLVVIAGIADPGSTLPLLRQFVQQGGQLVIAAGANFNPRSWNEADAIEGAGVLPARFQPELVGELPEDARQLNPQFLSFSSMGSHYYFRLADTAEDVLRDLYSLPMFFRYVEVDVSESVIEEMKQRELKQLTDEYDLFAQMKSQASASGTNGTGQAPANVDQKRLQELQPDWLLWNRSGTDAFGESLKGDAELRRQHLDNRAEETRPRVLARFENEQRSPCLVERRLGRGNVMFVASGLGSSWNTLHMTDTILMFDRMLRSMIQSTLPPRNFSTDQHIALPLETHDREVTLALWRPGNDDAPEVIDTGFIGKDVRGFTVANSVTSGLYRVAELDPATSTDGNQTVLKEIPLAVNGDPRESELTPLSREQFDERTSGANLRWVGAGEEISLQGSQAYGQDFYWMILVIGVIVFLLAELVILAWPAVQSRVAEAQTE